MDVKVSSVGARRKVLKHAVNEFILNLLLDYLEEQKHIRQDNAPFYHDEGFIFTSNEAYPKVIKAVCITYGKTSLNDE